MTSKQTVVKMIVQVDAGNDSNPNWLQAVTRDLRDELEAKSDAVVEHATGEAAPENARSIAGLEIGALAVVALPVAVSGLFDCLRDWLQARRGEVLTIKIQHGDRSVEIPYHANHASKEDVTALVEKLLGVVSG